MYPSALLMFDTVSPSDRFTTTYSQDFGPPHAWKKSRTQPAALRASPKIINTYYGSAVGSQNLPGSFSSSLLSTFSSLTPSFGGPVGRVCSTLDKRAGLSLDKDEDQHCCICDENDKKIFCAAEANPRSGTFGSIYTCDDRLRCLHQEPDHLSLPVPRPIFTLSPNTDADNRERWGLGPVLQLKSRTIQQSSYNQCIFCEWDEPVIPLPIHHSTTQPVDHPQQSSWWKPPLTEYQAQFAAPWPQPRNRHAPPCHRNLYPFKL